MKRNVRITPMTRAEYNELRGWSLPSEEDGNDMGNLVDYGIKFKGEPFIQWLPKEIFDEFVTDNPFMTFGEAIEAAKKGKKVYRIGWNGKGLFVVYQKGYPQGIPANKNTAEAFGVPEGTLHKVQPYLVMRCVDGSHQMWVASQSDILANDWCTRVE